MAEVLENNEEPDTLPKVNEEIENEDRRYLLESVLGSGGYGTVFLSHIGKKAVAIKAEKYSRVPVHTEELVLRAANASNAIHFCELLDFGTVSGRYVYTVMTLLYHDLSKLRYETADRRFSTPSAVRIAMQTLDAIEELHSVGFVSRDIKPNNFAPGHRSNRQSKIIFMYDFGLARRYIDRHGKVIPSRGEVGWRGTTRYGSLNAHQRLDLGRRDDLESWLYMIVEVTYGRVPWRMKNDREFVRQFKQRIRFGKDRVAFFTGCPDCYGDMMSEIDALQFESTPPYNTLRQTLQQYCDKTGIDIMAPWEWDGDGDSLYSEQSTELESNEMGAATSA